MKTLIKCAICALFFSLCMFQLQAQVIENQANDGLIEMTPYDLKALFNEDLKVSADLLKVNANILDTNVRLLSSLAANTKNTAKKRPVRIQTPLELQHNGKCYQIGCAKNGCSKCGLFWWDRNKDNKVQPRKELRCVCKESKSQCELRGREIDCD